MQTQFEGLKFGGRRHIVIGIQRRRLAYLRKGYFTFRFRFLCTDRVQVVRGWENRYFKGSMLGSCPGRRRASASRSSRMHCWLHSASSGVMITTCLGTLPSAFASTIMMSYSVIIMSFFNVCEWFVSSCRSSERVPAPARYRARALLSWYHNIFRWFRMNFPLRWFGTNPLSRISTGADPAVCWAVGGASGGNLTCAAWCDGFGSSAMAAVDGRKQAQTVSRDVLWGRWRGRRRRAQWPR